MAKRRNPGPILNKGYEEALKYPFFEAVLNRRSRRFGLGMELRDSSLEFTSNHDPVPLDELEEALLVWSGTGLTGLCLADLPPETGIDLLCQQVGSFHPYTILIDKSKYPGFIISIRVYH